ncbi:MAG TPA: FecR domain-containing protein, partial [Anseongella sp.]|nr:FecR domain-containing protein [Anseongella sp.]
ELNELLDIILRAEYSETVKSLMDTAWEDAGKEDAAAEVNWQRMYDSVLQRKRTGTSWLRKIAAAAAVLVLTSGVFYAYRYFTGKAANRVHYVEVVTGTGQREKIVLPDSSIAWLNASSRLKYPSSFSGGKRDVFLTGEAFFQVEHDQNRPFLVYSRRVMTKVLGTEFNVNSYDDQASIAVTVLNGRVAVNDSLNSLGVLTSDQQITYDINTGRANTRKVNAAALIAWHDGELVFDNTTFDRAAEIIEKWYGVEVQFMNDGLKACEFTARFRMEDDLDQVLTVICGLNQADYSYQDVTVSINGRGCK